MCITHVSTTHVVHLYFDMCNTPKTPHMCNTPKTPHMCSFILTFCVKIMQKALLNIGSVTPTNSYILVHDMPRMRVQFKAGITAYV